jgi:fatty-acyl-CoA synthase
MLVNLAVLHETISAAIPEREALVFRGRTMTYADFTARTRRAAHAFRRLGLGCRTERAHLPNWASGQDHVAIYCYNGPEYLETMYGAYKARATSINVNYRYKAEELVYVLATGEARALVYHACFAPTVAAIRGQLPALRHLIQVADDSGEPLLPGALDYDALLAAERPDPLDLPYSPDDLYVLYTGGTTGMPKGVLWRQADIFVCALGGQRRALSGEEFASLGEIVERAVAGKAALRSLPSAPFMHGAAHWSAFHTLYAGGTVVIQANSRSLDPEDILRTVERERVQSLLIIGDAFARPLLDALGRGQYDLRYLSLLVTGGAALTASLKRDLLARVPGLTILDTMGSSETGTQAQHLSNDRHGAATGTFRPGAGNMVLSEDLSRVLAPGSAEVGWFARAGRAPLGYLGDPQKSARTFPSVAGQRCSVPGDRARINEDGSIVLLGRDSVTINSGGEKIFAEEVEQALKHHPAVYDVVVVGRPSERWGQEVVAIVKLKAGCDVAPPELLEECARHVARFKVPKEVILAEQIVRSPSGKADYRWARSRALESPGSGRSG